jgi:hypothetical protein
MKVIKEYYHRGIHLGSTIESSLFGKRKRWFELEVDPHIIEYFLAKLPLEAKLNLGSQEPGLKRSADVYGIDVRDYIADCEVIDLVLKTGFKTEAQLRNKRPGLYRAVVAKDLEGKILPYLQPADLSRDDR